MKNTFNVTADKSNKEEVKEANKQGLSDLEVSFFCQGFTHKEWKKSGNSCFLQIKGDLHTLSTLQKFILASNIQIGMAIGTFIDVFLGTSVFLQINTDI